DRRERPGIRQDRDAVRRRRPPRAGRFWRDPQPRPRRPVRRHHEGNLLMNATADTLPVAKAPAHRTHRFALLLRREYWEHRGGFFWAPVIAGAVSLLLTAIFLVIALVGIRNADSDARIHLDDGTTMSINGLDLGVLAGQLSAEDKAQLASGIDMTMLLASSWPYMVMVFVMFFYCLGALYDERKDRSVLF